MLPKIILNNHSKLNIYCYYLINCVNIGMWLRILLKKATKSICFASRPSHFVILGKHAIIFQKYHFGYGTPLLLVLLVLLAKCFPCTLDIAFLLFT